MYIPSPVELEILALDKRIFECSTESVLLDMMGDDTDIEPFYAKIYFNFKFLPTKKGDKNCIGHKEFSAKTKDELFKNIQNFLAVKPNGWIYV